MRPGLELLGELDDVVAEPQSSAADVGIQWGRRAGREPRVASAENGPNLGVGDKLGQAGGIERRGGGIETVLPANVVKCSMCDLLRRRLRGFIRRPSHAASIARLAAGEGEEGGNLGSWEGCRPLVCGASCTRSVAGDLGGYADRLVPRLIADASLQPVAMAVAVMPESGEQNEDRGDDGDDDRQAEEDAQPVDKRGEEDGDDNGNHGRVLYPEQRRAALPESRPFVCPPPAAASRMPRHFAPNPRRRRSSTYRGSIGSV